MCASLVHGLELAHQPPLAHGVRRVADALVPLLLDGDGGGQLGVDQHLAGDDRQRRAGIM